MRAASTPRSSRDVAVALAPLDAAQAEKLLRSLRVAPLLDGARGHAPLDVAAAAPRRGCALLDRSRAPGDRRDRDQPAARDADGALGLDARVVLEDGADAR